MASKSASFLSDTANDVCHHLGGDLAHCLMLLPSSLGADIVHHHLVGEQGDSLHAVLQVKYIDTWVIQQSGLQVPSHLELLTILYTCWQQLEHDITESFEQFYGWGSMLLQEFDVVDRYLVNAEALFQNVYEQKKFKPTFGQLSAAEQQAIASFWHTFKRQLSAHQQDFLTCWKLVSQLYTTFTEALLKQHKGYTGLCYKWVFEHLTPTFIAGVQQVVVIGFHDLPPATDKIFAWLHAQVPMSFYWDLDAAYMQDERQEAGYHLRSYQNKPYLQASFRQPFPNRIYDLPKKITLHECHSSISQLKRILEVLAPAWQDVAALQPQSIGIILADETLLVPLLAALPVPYASTYTTIGYPLVHTMAYQLVAQLCGFQLTLQQSPLSAHTLPTASVMSLLAHPWIQRCDRAGFMQMVARLQQDYPNSVPQHVLTSANRVYNTLFQPITSGIQLLHYLKTVVDLLLEQPPEQQVSDNDLLEQKALLLLQDKLAELHNHPEVLKGLSMEEIKCLFHACTQKVAVPFGKALHTTSVFILDISSTMNLDFQQVYILGMNEGCWPRKNNICSFIPYNLRRGYGLPTQTTSQASMEAYYFYRLFQRAEQIHITYTNTTRGADKSEMSRYVWQLLYESKLPIAQEKSAAMIVSAKTPPIIIHKDASIMATLDSYLATPTAPSANVFTPAALNTYIDCSLRFYFKYILQLKAALSDQETEAIQFGNIVHKVLEELYRTLLGQKTQVPVQQADIIALKSQVKQVLTRTLDTAIYSGCSQEGWVIEQAIIEKVVHKILDLDAAYVPFELWGIEVGHKGSLVTPFMLKDGKRMLLGGIIDRVDYRHGSIRAIDYKTGNDSTAAACMDSLFTQSTTRNKAFLQVMFYAWLLQRQPKYQAQAVMPLLITIRDIFQSDFDPRLKFTKHNQDLKKVHKKDDGLYVNDIAPYVPALEGCLNEVLTALLNPAVPFVQTDQLSTCSTCAYKRICQRM